MRKPDTLIGNTKIAAASHVIGATIKTLQDCGFSDIEICYFFNKTKKILQVLKSAKLGNYIEYINK